MSKLDWRVACGRRERTLCQWKASQCVRTATPLLVPSLHLIRSTNTFVMLRLTLSMVLYIHMYAFGVQQKKYNVFFLFSKNNNLIINTFE